MKKILLVLLLGIVLTGCDESPSEKYSTRIENHEAMEEYEKEEEMELQKAKEKGEAGEMEYYLDRNIAGMYKPTIDVMEDGEGYSISVKLYEDSLVDNEYNSVSQAVGIIEAMKSNRADMDSKVTKYKFTTHDSYSDKGYEVSLMNGEFKDSTEIKVISFKDNQEITKTYGAFKKQQDVELQASSRETDRTLMRMDIEELVDSGDYRSVSKDKVTVNYHQGTEDNEDDFIALIYLKFEEKNTEDTANEMMRMYSDDIVARLGKETEVATEVSIFWEDEYNGKESRYYYEYSDGGFYLTEELKQ